MRADVFFYHKQPLISPNISFPVPIRATRLNSSFPPLKFGHHRIPLFRSIPNFKVLRRDDSGRGVFELAAADAFLGMGDSDLPVEICRTHTLPPALMLEDAASRIKEAVEQLKLNPPCFRSGVLRFQVALPASIKALNWLCSQPESSVALPQFYVSDKQLDKQTHELVLFDRVIAISAIGSAVYFTGSSISVDYGSIKRYLSVDAPHIIAYGVMDFTYDHESSLIKHETGSFYVFIPQVKYISDFFLFVGYL